MARTKQTSRANNRQSYPRATFNFIGENSSGIKKKKKPKKSRSGFTNSRYGWRPSGNPNLGFWGSSSAYNYDDYHWPPSSSQVVDLVDSSSDDDEFGHDALDDEVLFGSLRGNIVGIRYYRGTVNNNEMVALEREPHNIYDRNAIKVKNVDGQQVGHIKKELAAPLANIMDNDWARLEGVVPFGSQNAFSMPVDLTLWGLPEKKAACISKLRSCGFFMKEAPDMRPGTSAGLGAGPSFGLSVPTRRVFLSPSEVKNELDKLFENIQEGDKTTEAEPAKAIGAHMYSHQKQALNWMIQRENGNHLPPFWEAKNGEYFNSVTVFTSKNKPKSVCGGILADDMGLGKTLEMIALIVTNFKDGEPLAVPVPGKIRHSKQVRDKQKALRLAGYKMESKKTMNKISLKGDPKDFIVSDGEQTPKKLKQKTLRDIGNPKNVESSPLPTLPEDEDSSDTDDSDSDTELVDDVVMTQKEDPDFAPALKDSKPSKENESPGRFGRRPRRSVKKPARYTYSSESELDGIESPAKKAKVLISINEEEQVVVVGKGKSKGKGKGKQLKPKAIIEEKKVLSYNKNVESNKTKSDGIPLSDCAVTGNREKENTDKTSVQMKESIVVLEPLKEPEISKPDIEMTACESEDELLDPAVDKIESHVSPVKTNTTVTEECKKVTVECKPVDAESKSTEAESEPTKVESKPTEAEHTPTVTESKSIEDNSLKQGTGELPKDYDCRGVKRGRCKVEDCDCDCFERWQSDPKCAYCNDVPTKHENLQPKPEQKKDVPSASEDASGRKEAIQTIGIPQQKSTTTSKALPGSSVSSPRPSSSRDLHSTPHDDLPDIGGSVNLYSSPGTSKCGKTSGRTQTKGARTTLIVCPLSVLSNWLDQLEDHVQENVHLDIYTYYGSSRTKDPNVLAKQDIVLTTYSTLAADSKGDNILKKVAWLRIVLDEGHVIRNPNALQTKAIYALKAERKWVLTGTPIQNSLKDLWSLVNFLQISPFTDRQWWHRAIERPLDNGDESALKRVQHLMGAISMRRTKTQKVNDKPIVELPERNVFVEHITLSEDERSVYDAMQKEGKIIVSKFFKQGTLLHHYGDVLAILMRLRQMCCHPLLVAKAAAAMKDVVDTFSAEPGSAINDELRQKLISSLLTVLNSGSDEECSVCLDGLKQPVITQCAHVFCRKCIESVINNEKPHPRCPLCRGNIDTDTLLEVPPEQIHKDNDNDDSGEITAETWKSSSKVDALMKGLLQLREENPSIKSIIVSQFTSLLTLLEIPLRQYGFKFTRLDGTMSMKQRTKSIEEFSDVAPGSPTICLLSLKAGGVGINLIAASRIFLMDPAWNPASEEQCFDRCHRLGQTKDVTVTKFIVDDSVEVRMMELQERKRQLMQGAFGNKKETAEQRRQNRIRDIKALMDF